MNCAIMVRQPGTHPAPVPTTAATTKPATAPEAAKSIRSTDDLINEFPDQFKGIGKFPGQCKIWLHHDAHPVIHAPRKCPIALCPKVKEHLNKMEHLGVITHVDKPTDWVSSITYVQKANGKLCLHLDPNDLNEAICLNHHKMPTMEKVAHKFAHSHFFTKLDACHGYWSIILDQDSSLLTTFNSPFGRYHFLQLPFGLVCSQDIFQKKMDQILKECQGCIRITDDITIPGCTEVEHDAHLRDLMHITCKYDLVFNPQKTHVKAQAINFFGCLYDANGVHPDPGKVNAVHALPAPTNITELQEFLGLVTYLSPFIPGLSTLTATLWELLKKDTDFIWNCTYDTAFEQIKEAIISDTTLRYFDHSLPMTIQVAASQVGLGTPLLKNGKPVAFASNTLTETECQYANIEREMLAAVFGVERFHTYIYGWSFTIESDHKPLESISRKKLADTPAWLQCMMLCLQGYDFTICYCPGKEMVIPDTLSWFSPCPGPDLPLDIAIHHACIMPDCKEAFQQAFINDPEIQALADLIITGWLKDIKEVPCPLCPYWQHRETLTIEDSLVLWCEALMIPFAERERTLHQLHEFHQGITVTVAHTWKFLLAQHQQGHQRSSLPVWSLHPVAEPECSSTPHTYTYTIVPMADVCHRYLHARRNWPPDSGWLLLEDDLSLMSSTQPEQCQQGHLTTEGDVFRAWHPQSPLLWQWPSVCECPVHRLLYILGHIIWNLKSALPTIQWICWGMHQVCQTCTPMSQVQQCWSRSGLTSTLSYTNWHQASISSRAVVQMPTQNNHSSQDTQQQPISHTCRWADQHMLWIC